MKVLKFGGTSMGSSDSLENVVEIIVRADHPVVVCSAMSQVTNKLHAIEQFLVEQNIEEARALFEVIRDGHLEVADHFEVREAFEASSGEIFELLLELIGQGRELSDHQKALLIACGERLSVRLLSAILNTREMDSLPVDSTFIRTQGRSWSEDELDWEETKVAVADVLNPLLEQGKIPIVTGYFGTTPEGHFASLGRGSSDFTGAILSVCLDRKTLEIWTDVDGFMTADPRIVEGADVLSELNYQEVTELCFFGAKVLHPKTIRPVVDNAGEVWIKNTFDAGKHGTRIVRQAEAAQRSVLSIASKPTVVASFDLFDTSVTAHRSRVMMEVFRVFEQYGYSVDSVTTREGEVSVCFERKYLENKSFVEAFEQVAPVHYLHDRSVISIVFSEKAKNQVGVVERIARVLAAQDISIKILSQTASEVCLCLVIPDEQSSDAVQAIHKELIKIEHTMEMEFDSDKN